MRIVGLPDVDDEDAAYEMASNKLPARHRELLKKGQIASVGNCRCCPTQDSLDAARLTDAVLEALSACERVLAGEPGTGRRK